MPLKKIEMYVSAPEVKKYSNPYPSLCVMPIGRIFLGGWTEQFLSPFSRSFAPGENFLAALNRTLYPNFRLILPNLQPAYHH